MGNALNFFGTNPTHLPGQGLLNANTQASNAGGAGKAGQNYTTLLNWFIKDLPAISAAQGTYGPQFAQENANSFATQLPTISGALNQANASQAASMNDTVGTLGTSAATNWGKAYDASNPATMSLLGNLTTTANSGLAAGSQLSPADLYSVTNNIRSDWANRGLGSSMPAALQQGIAEAVGGQNLLNQRTQTASSVAGQNMQVNQAAMQPLLQMLLGQSNAASFAQPNTSTLMPASLQGSLLGSTWDALNANARTTSGNNTQMALKAVDEIMSGIGMGIGACWAAREIFGAQDARWKQFRFWMLLKAPARLRTWYLQHGEHWAERLRGADPFTRRAVRTWMRARIRQTFGKEALCPV